MILGPQGSGKGTQAKLLVKKLAASYFEGGEILRQKAKEDSPLGRKINRIINQEGRLVPDEVITRIVQEWLSQTKARRDIVFDGYPRNLNQYHALQKMLAKKKQKIDEVIFLKVSRETSLKRLNARRVCPQCGLEYNLVTKQPLKDEFCDQCSIKLVQRPDDTTKTIQKRLAIYYQATEPIVNLAKSQGILLEIDGERSIEAISQEILSKFK